MNKDKLIQARRSSNMKTARLEHAILQTVIDHVAEHHLSRAQIVMALVNVAAYWQKKVILSAISKELSEEEDGS
jgi:hypothetical protein